MTFDFEVVDSTTAYILFNNESILYKSNNGCQTFTAQNVPFQNSINSMSFNDKGEGWLFGDKGLILTNTDINVGISNITHEIPKSHYLHQNYPNPFNPSTKIKFDIPKGSLVKLKVYDILGREVAELVNEKLNAGVYEYEWNGVNLSSGVYFYRLETGEFVETKRMVLAK